MINTEKKRKNTGLDICPICWGKYSKKNNFVIYHIRYFPPLVIIACKYCNYTEYLLRNNISSKFLIKHYKRLKAVIKYHYKFGIKI